MGTARNLVSGTSSGKTFAIFLEVETWCHDQISANSNGGYWWWREKAVHNFFSHTHKVAITVHFQCQGRGHLPACPYVVAPMLQKAPIHIQFSDLCYLHHLHCSTFWPTEHSSWPTHYLIKFSLQFQGHQFIANPTHPLSFYPTCLILWATSTSMCLLFWTADFRYMKYTNLSIILTLFMINMSIVP